MSKDDDIDVKFTNKNFSIVSKDAKDKDYTTNNNISKKSKYLNESFKSDIKSEID
jgi:hypothetical protein